MSSPTYQAHAAICAKFYELTLNSQEVAEFLITRSGIHAGQKALFVGGMFQIAKYLIEQGIHLTVLDYSSEMVLLGKEALPNTTVKQGDLRALPFQEEFDFVFVIGRVFTHMISDTDLEQALLSCLHSLRPAGHLFFDNYESSKIRVTPYFNGEVIGASSDTEIRRVSSTTLLSESPYIVDWRAQYSGHLKGQEFLFEDRMEHRAWSRSEINTCIQPIGYSVLRQGDNFDETSFFTLAQKRAHTKRS